MHVYIVAAPIVLSSLSHWASSLSDTPGSSIVIFDVHHICRGHWQSVYGKDVYHDDIHTASLLATCANSFAFQGPAASTEHARENGADMG